MSPSSISVQEFWDAKHEILELQQLNEAALDRDIADADINSPGLALAGHTGRLPSGRMWVFGETEMTYIASSDPTPVGEALEAVLSREVPAVVVSKGQEVPDFFIEIASRHGVPVFRSGLATGALYRLAKPFLEQALAPSTSLHGSLASVYGVGLLFTGKSGIGKSECVLDLVERGHRLVADDLVLVSQQGNDVLIGRAHDLQGHHMEIRGIGIIDVPALFGVHAVRQQKRIEVVVDLELWDSSKEYSRTGLELEYEDILGVRIPRVTVPLNPGKNITVIAEVVAMNHLLRYQGVYSAEAFDQRLRQHLEQDYE